jgi:ATP synthase protein I
VDAAAVTSAENLTKSPGKEPEEYSGLRLGSIQSAIVEDAIIVGGVADTSATAQAESGQDQSVHQSAQSGEPQSQEISLPPPSEASMQDYYQLQQNLLGLTVAFAAVIFPCVWGFYSLQIALDYILGACAGVVYLRMLGKNVSAIGRQKKNSSAGRLAVFAGVMIVAMRWQQLEVIPVFLGFLTYKAALIAFVLWTSVKPQAAAPQRASQRESSGREST